jgi:putative membrane protein
VTSGGQVAGAGWQRVHPLTPLVKSWQVIVIGGIAVLQNVGTDWLTGSGRDPGLPGARIGGRIWLVGAGIALGVGALLVGAIFLSWRMTRYRVTADAVEIYSGVLFRQHRRAQLDRLQAVDVVQPILARILGLARLTIEVAGSGDSAIALAYLREEQARALRNHILAASAGLDVAEGTPAPEAPEHSMLEVPLPRLAASIALSGTTLAFLVVAVGSVVAALALRDPAPLAATFPTLLGVAGTMWQRFSGEFGFRVAGSPDGLRLRHGLLEQRSQTVPPGRVQAIELAQALLWRRAGWWRIRVNIAGYGRGAGEAGARHETVLLPVGGMQDVVAVLAVVIPDLGVGPGERPVDVVRAGMEGSGADGSFVTSPPSARWLDPLGWRRNGFRVTGEVLLARRGRLRRHLTLIPHARTQSLEVTQGVLQRRLGLASFALHSTVGPVRPEVPHLTVPMAASLLREQSERARQARAAAGPERWMTARTAAPRVSPPRAEPPPPLPPPLPGPPAGSTGLQQPAERPQPARGDEFGLG